jgi:hypothetical protein
VLVTEELATNTKKFTDGSLRRPRHGEAALCQVRVPEQIGLSPGFPDPTA